MTAQTEAAARKFLETKDDADLRGIIEAAADRHLPITDAHRADLDWNARAARQILADRAA